MLVGKPQIIQGLLGYVGLLRRELQEATEASGLPQSHRPSLGHLLGDFEGGDLAYEVSVLRAWSLGATPPQKEFQCALDGFSSRGPDELERELTRSRPVGVKLFEIPPALHETAKPDLTPFRITGLYFDPVIDFEPYRTSFESLERATERGPRLEVGSENLLVAASPGVPLGNQSDLYRAVGDPDLSLYLLENILYVIRSDGIPAVALSAIKASVESGVLVEVRPVLFSDLIHVIPQPHPIKYPWQDNQENGPLNLQSVGVSSRRRWIQGVDEPALSSFEEVPSLHQWLLRHREFLHWTDLKKLQGQMESLWRSVVGGSPSRTQAENLTSQISGILGEIWHRKEMREAFRLAHATDPDRVLLVEGEIRTSDGLMVSDGLIGRLDPALRVFEIQTAFEVTNVERLAQKSERQHEQTLERRFPEKGLVVLDKSGTWGRLSVKSEGASRRVFTAPSAVSKSLRETSLAVLDEILALLAIRRSIARFVPLEERKGYGSIRGITAAGRLLAGVTQSLWEKFDGLTLLVSQIEARILHLPPIAQELFRAYLAALANVSRDLNENGRRRLVSELAQEITASRETIRRFQHDIEEKLRIKGLEILPNPSEHQAARRRSGAKAKLNLKKVWEQGTAQGIAETLDREIENEKDEETRKSLLGYRAVLTNVASDLNARGKRETNYVLAARTGCSHHAITDYTAEVIAKLTEKGIAILPADETYTDRVLTGHRASLKIREAWVHHTLTDVCSALQVAIDAETDDKMRKTLNTHFLNLVNVSADLNLSGERLPLKDVTRHAGVSRSIARDAEAHVEKILRSRGWEILPNPEEKRGATTMSGQKATKIIESVLEKETIREVASALQESISSQGDPLIRKYLEAYRHVLVHISQELNVSGERPTTAAMASAIGVGSGTIFSYTTEIEGELKKRGSGVLPNPGEGHASSVRAGRRFVRFLEDLWQKANPAEVVEGLDEFLKAEDDHMKKLAIAYREVLITTSADLNPTGIRKSLWALAPELGVSHPTLVRYRRWIEDRLREGGFSICDEGA